jgi:hypothetical protein
MQLEIATTLSSEIIIFMSTDSWEGDFLIECGIMNPFSLIEVHCILFYRKLTQKDENF